MTLCVGQPISKTFNPKGDYIMGKTIRKFNKSVETLETKAQRARLRDAKSKVNRSWRESDEEPTSVEKFTGDDDWRQYAVSETPDPEPKTDFGSGMTEQEFALYLDELERSADFQKDQEIRELEAEEAFDEWVASMERLWELDQLVQVNAIAPDDFDFDRQVMEYKRELGSRVCYWKYLHSNGYMHKFEELAD
jgi:hypothetical protein